MIDCTEWARNPHTRAAPHTSKLSDCVSKRLCVFNQVLEAVRILDDTVYLLHTKQRQACCPGFSALRDASRGRGREPLVVSAVCLCVCVSVCALSVECAWDAVRVAISCR